MAMKKVKDVIKAIEALAPLKFQDEWDNSGLQVGFPEDELKGVLVCLDVTEEIVEEAISKGCS
ncbi:MAG: Nif3-like dinuclear metal center hexameric protein, partial [Bacteroidales bacterium]|nr:Nif3-like dinuclear metal center hexameric protein [Bacteroidales bacterium]